MNEEAGHTTRPNISQELELLRQKRLYSKSQVRVWITYAAAAFVFLGGIALTVIAFFVGEREFAQGLFLTILPVASVIIAFWFAYRSGERN